MSERGAIISPDGLYRYKLSRAWGSGPRLLWIMLNPSTADAHVDDPTIRKCVGFADRWGYRGIEVVNLFAWRATDPRKLIGPEDAVGPDNDATIRAVAWEAPAIVCAWGRIPNAPLRPRAELVAKLVRFENPGKTIRCLGRTAGGFPRHPLMPSYATKWEAF